MGRWVGGYVGSKGYLFLVCAPKKMVTLGPSEARASHTNVSSATRSCQPQYAMEAALSIIGHRRKSARESKARSRANQADVKRKAEKIRECKRQACRCANKTDEECEAEKIRERKHNAHRPFYVSRGGGAARTVPSSARLGAREDDDNWKDLMVFGSCHTEVDITKE